MGLYNFQKRFVVPILAHKKKHTIRATRRHPDKVGNIAHLYTGLRIKGAATLLGRFPIVKIEDIEISAGCVIRGRRCRCLPLHCRRTARIWIDDQELSGDEREKLARLDGFRDFTEMQQFWKGRLPFKGQIVHWNPSKQ
jgi:hypothetical protein